SLSPPSVQPGPLARLRHFPVDQRPDYPGRGSLFGNKGYLKSRYMSAMQMQDMDIGTLPENLLLQAAPHHLLQPFISRYVYRSVHSIPGGHIEKTMPFRPASSVHRLLGLSMGQTRPYL